MQTEHFKERLEAEKTRLEGELQGVGRKNPTNPSDWEPVVPAGSEESEADPLDVAERTTNFDTNASIVADLETRYNDVVSALEKIKNSVYGLCEFCGEPIEEARLEADPAAKTCLKHLNQ